MKISIDDAIKIALIGVGILSDLRDQGVDKLTSKEIERLYVDPDKLRKFRKKRKKK